MKVGDFVFIKFKKEDNGRLYDKGIISNLLITKPYEIIKIWDHPLYGKIVKLINLEGITIKLAPQAFYWFYQEDLTELNFIDD